MSEDGFANADAARAAAAGLRTARQHARGKIAQERRDMADMVEAARGTSSTEGGAPRLGLRQAEVQRIELMPELELRRASVIRRQAELLVKLVDQRIELQRVSQFSFGTGVVGKVLRNLFKFIERAWPAAMKQRGHGDLKGAQERDLFLELAELIFLHSFVSVRVHGFALPEIPFEDMAERIDVESAMHRLSEGVK